MVDGVFWLPRGVAAQLMVEDGRSCDWEFCSGGLGEMRMRMGMRMGMRLVRWLKVKATG